MTESSKPEDRTVLLQIQNRQKPYEIIHLVWDRQRNLFETEGLKHLFGVKEIRIEAKDLLLSIERYSQVLSFLLETMSAAGEYHLPYVYQNEFQFGQEKYSLHEDGDYRVLRPIGEDDVQALLLRV